VTIVDLYRDDRDQRIYLSVLIPILDKTAGNQTIGIVALRLDPTKYLYPFILRWPTPSQTAETLIVRRDGNNALFLNELKFADDSALKLRIPLEKTNVPAVMAVLGRTGIVAGTDYRGAAVIAAVRAVPDSSWFLVARINTTEVYAPARGQLWILIGSQQHCSQLRARAWLLFDASRISFFIGRGISRQRHAESEQSSGLYLKAHWTVSFARQEWRPRCAETHPLPGCMVMQLKK